MTGPHPFDDLTEEALRAGRGLKWTRFAPAIGAFVAEMDFGTAPAVTAALHEAVDAGRLGSLTPEAPPTWRGPAPHGRRGGTAGRCRSSGSLRSPTSSPASPSRS